MEKVIRVRKHQINKNHELFDFCDRKCFESKNLYNAVNYVLRQQFTNSKGYKKENFNCNAYNLAKSHKKDEEFKIMGSNFGECTLKVLSDAWESYFEKIKKYKQNPDQFMGKPGIPKYIKFTETGELGRQVATDRKINICQKGEYKGYFKFSREDVHFKPRIEDKIKQVRIVPSNHRADRITHYTIEIVYEKEIPEKIEKVEKIAGIDLNTKNLAVVVNNVNKKPFAINGRPLLNWGHYYLAKRKKFMKYVKARGTSNRIRKLTKKYTNKIDNYIHKASRFIVDKCKEMDIDTIIIGKNKNWKMEINLGHRNNYHFTVIPYNTLIEQIQYKAEEYGIKTEMTEESYTSKASFLDNDKLPQYDKEKDKHYNFSGKRIKRGLYKSKDGTLINADVNGAYNIIRKKYPDKIDCNITDKSLLHPQIINL